MPRPCLADLEGLLGLRSSSMPSCQVHCPIHQHILQGGRPYDRKSGSDGVRAWTSCMAHANSSSSSGPRRRVAFCRRIAVSHTSFECFKDNGKRELDYVPKTARMKSINSSYLPWQSPRIRSMCANCRKPKHSSCFFWCVAEKQVMPSNSRQSPEQTWRLEGLGRPSGTTTSAQIRWIFAAKCAVST